jgi:tRNA uridine 5-carbamoylmethylation protein Kti12
MSYYIIIRGPLGCGKSTICKEIAKHLDATVCSIDQVLAKNNLENDWEAGYISQKNFKRANEIVIPKAKKLLEKNKIVIFDGNFYWKSQIEYLTSTLKYPCYSFTLKADMKTCIRRDSNRPKPHGEDAARAVFSKSTEFDYGIIIDVTKSLKDCISKILSNLPKNK